MHQGKGLTKEALQVSEKQAVRGRGPRPVALKINSLMLGRVLFIWDGPFSGAMLNFEGVFFIEEIIRTSPEVLEHLGDKLKHAVGKAFLVSCYCKAPFG